MALYTCMNVYCTLSACSMEISHNLRDDVVLDNSCTYIQIILRYYFECCGGLTSFIWRRSIEIWINTMCSVCRSPWNGNWVHTKTKCAKGTIQSCRSLQSDSNTSKFTKSVENWVRNCYSPAAGSHSVLPCCKRWLTRLGIWSMSHNTIGHRSCQMLQLFALLTNCSDFNQTV
jgi:hypothetical protein